MTGGGCNGCTIDASALESLEAINHRLMDGGIVSPIRVEGPIMGRLKRSYILEELSGTVHLAQYHAVSSINPELAHHTLDGGRNLP